MRCRLIGEGRFRAGLCYRLHVIPVALPPLRERRADIVPLAEHFLHLSNPDAPRRLAADAAAFLQAGAWPGNVRELRNAIERAAALARGMVVQASDLCFLQPAAMPQPDVAGQDLTLPEAVAPLEQAMIRRALAEAGGSRTEAARKLGIHRQLLYEKMKRHGLDSGP